MTETEIRAAAIEAAARVFEGRASNAYAVIRQAQAFEHYVRTGQNIE